MFSKILRHSYKLSRNLALSPNFEQLSNSLTSGPEFKVEPLLPFETMETPLFQASFFPDFTQVYFMLATVFVEFNFAQVVPAIGAEFAGNKVAINSALIKVATRGNLVRSMS